MALSNLYINKIVSSSTDDNASENIKALYGVKTISCGGSQFIDGQSVIDALLAKDNSSAQASTLKAGAVVQFYGKYWILLEDAKTISGDSDNVALKLLSKENISKSSFGDVNNFGQSSICRYLNGVRAATPSSKWTLTYPGLDNIEIDTLQKFGADAALTAETTVAQNGDTTYTTEAGQMWDKNLYGYVALLSETDFKKYYDTDGVLTKVGASVSEPYWLMTGTGCNSKRVVIAQPDGTLSSALCTTQCGVRPIIVAKIAKTATIQVAQLGS